MATDTMLRFTIDELAARAGTTTRNLRAFQTKAALGPARLVGRTAYYSELDLNRVRAVLRLQALGYSLAAISDLLAAWAEGRTLEEVLGLPRRPRRRRGPNTDDIWEATFDELPPNVSRVPFTLLPEVS
jgi:DNA-binding transcriptional MerR regulator